MTPPRTAPAAAPTLDDEPVDAEIVPDDEPRPPAALVPMPTPTPRAGLSLVHDDPWAAEAATVAVAPQEARTGIRRLEYNAKAGGGFVDPETGEKVMSLDFIWLDRVYTRAWWRDAFGKGDAKPNCRSDDGIVPTEDSDKQSPACATCPHAQWTDDPPSCKESINALALVLGGDSEETESGYEYGNLVRIRFGGLAFTPARDYFTSFFRRQPQFPSYAFVTHVVLEEEDRPPNGKFLVPRFRRDPQPLPFADAVPLKSMLGTSKPGFQADVAADVAEGVDQRGEDEGDPFAASGRSGDTTTQYPDEEPF